MMLEPGWSRLNAAVVGFHWSRWSSWMFSWWRETENEIAVWRLALQTSARRHADAAERLQSTLSRLVANL